MGYYSKLAATYTPREDFSFTPPEMQLRWRLEDLQTRLQELSGDFSGGAILSESDLRYVLPERLTCPADVRRAIDLATDDLWQRYGIRVAEPDAPPEMDEITGMQISFAA